MAKRTRCPEVGCESRFSTAEALAKHIRADHLRAPPATAGRPLIEFDMDQIHEMAKIQCTQGEMAAILGVSEDTITRRIQQDPDFAEALKRGRSEGKESLRKAQWGLALGGNATMQIWLGKNELGQSDKREVQVDVHHHDHDESRERLLDAVRRRREQSDNPGTVH